MAERPDVTRRDSLDDKELHIDGITKPVAEDTSPANPKDGTLNDHDDDVEKAHDKAVPPEPLRRIVTAQDWTGPDDTENPMNWYHDL